MFASETLKVLRAIRSGDLVHSRTIAKRIHKPDNAARAWLHFLRTRGYARTGAGWCRITSKGRARLQWLEEHEPQAD